MGIVEEVFRKECNM